MDNGAKASSILLGLLCCLGWLFANQNAWQRNWQIVTRLQQSFPDRLTADQFIGYSERSQTTTPIEGKHSTNSLGLSGYFNLAGYPDEAIIALGEETQNSSLSAFWRTYSWMQQGQEADALNLMGEITHIDAYLAKAGFDVQETQDYQLATALLERAAQFDSGQYPTRSTIYIHLSRNAYYHADDLMTALKWGYDWITADPTDTRSYIWVAGLHLWAKEPEKAQTVLDSGMAWGVAENRSYPGLMGQIMQSSGDLPAAIIYYREMWEMLENTPSANWYLGQALYKNGQTAEATPYLESVLASGEERLIKLAQALLAD